MIKLEIYTWKYDTLFYAVFLRQMSMIVVVTGVGKSSATGLSVWD